MVKGVRIESGVVKNVNFNRDYSKYAEILRSGHKDNFPFETRDGKQAYFYRGILDNQPGVIFED